VTYTTPLQESRSFPSTYYYDSGGYSGSIGAIGSPNEVIESAVRDYTTPWQKSNSFPSQYYYQGSKYSGNIPKNGPVESNGLSGTKRMYRQYYWGTVYAKPVYSQTYSGTVSMPGTYSYTINYSYETASAYLDIMISYTDCDGVVRQENGNCTITRMDKSGSDTNILPGRFSIRANSSDVITTFRVIDNASTSYSPYKDISLSNLGKDDRLFTATATTAKGLSSTAVISVKYLHANDESDVQYDRTKFMIYGVKTTQNGAVVTQYFTPNGLPPTAPEPAYAPWKYTASAPYGNLDAAGNAVAAAAVRDAITRNSAFAGKSSYLLLGSWWVDCRRVSTGAKQSFDLTGYRKTDPEGINKFAKWTDSTKQGFAGLANNEIGYSGTAFGTVIETYVDENGNPLGAPGSHAMAFDPSILASVRTTAPDIPGYSVLRYEGVDSQGPISGTRSSADVTFTSANGKATIKWIYRQNTGITVTVLDARSNAPIQGATVSSILGAGSTNSYGVVSYNGISNGTYRFDVSAPGYNQNSGAATISSSSPSAAVVIYLGVPSSGTLGCIIAYVYEEGTSRPISGATVTAAGKSITTDGRGEGVIPDIALSTYEVRCTKSGYTNPKPIICSIGQGYECGVVTFYLNSRPPTGNLHLTVREEGSGKVIPDAQVSIPSAAFTGYSNGSGEVICYNASYGNHACYGAKKGYQSTSKTFLVDGPDVYGTLYLSQEKVVELRNFRLSMIKDYQLEGYYRNPLWTMDGGGSAGGKGIPKYLEKDLDVNGLCADRTSFAGKAGVPNSFHSLTKGYSFRFKLDSYELNEKTDLIRITPTFHTVDSQGRRSQSEAALFWRDSRGGFHRVGEGAHSKWRIIELGDTARKSMVGSQAVWTGEYLIPATSFAAAGTPDEAGAKLQYLTETYLKEDIIVCFQIQAIRNGAVLDEYNTNYWVKERTNVRMPYQIGDVIRYGFQSNSLFDIRTRRIF